MLNLTNTQEWHSEINSFFSVVIWKNAAGILVDSKEKTGDIITFV